MYMCYYVKNACIFEQVYAFMYLCGCGCVCLYVWVCVYMCSCMYDGYMCVHTLVQK